MAVGAQTNQGNVNQTLTNLAVRGRDLAIDALKQWSFLNKLGQQGLEDLGFAAADAQEVLTLIDYMATLAQIYQGQATQASPFNYQDALTLLWAGQ